MAHQMNSQSKRVHASSRPRCAASAFYRGRTTAAPRAAGRAVPKMGWESTRSAVHASLQVLDLVDGRILIPRHITHIVLEIGCNGHNLLWDQPLPRCCNLSQPSHSTMPLDHPMMR